MLLDTEKIDLRVSLNLNFQILSIFGYWPPENLNGNLFILYRIYGILIIGFFFIVYTITEVINIALSLNDLTKLTDATFLFLTHLAQVFKLYYFTVNHDRILRLLNSLNRTIFQPRNKRQRKMIEVTTGFAKDAYIMFVILCAATVIAWAMFPLMDNDDGNVELPLSAWYPFDTNKSPIFTIIYLYQFFAVIMDATTNVSMDTVASGFMAHICAQLDVLNDALLHLREQSIFNLKMKYPKINHDDKSEYFNRELQKEMDKELIRCIVHHINIIEMAQEIGYLFDISVFSQFSAGCIILCVTMFELTLVSILSIQFLGMLLYQACILTEIIFYCWYGNEIILKSSQLSNSAYFCEWTDASTSFKQNLLMIMVRSFRPMRLYAGNLFTLSLETFMTILRTSWSYFAVLYQVHSRE